MKNLFKSGIVALALTAAAAAVTGPAAAAGVAINFGDVAVGYSDGYWDNSHHWHHWDSRRAHAYRMEHRDHYYAWRHDDRRHRHHGWHR